MRNGWLDGDDIAVLTRQGVDACSPGLEIRFESVPVAHAPYGVDFQPGARWLVHLGERTAKLALFVDNGMPSFEIVGRVMAAIAADADTHGRQLPPCPGHDHAADIHLDGADRVVQLLCPDTGDEIDRIVPAVSAAS